MSQRSEEERIRARRALVAMIEAPVTLPRRVYFVPGWRDEIGSCWDRMEKWIPKVVTNWRTHVTFVQFVGVDGAGTPPWEDFLDFGDDLAELVRRDLGGSPDPVDFVAHSMGGLDTAAAIALLDGHPELGTPALRCSHTVIAYDTPFLGFAAARNELFRKFVAADRKDPWLLLQLGAMEAGSKRIAELSRARGTFLENLCAFWPRGAENYDGILEVPHESASFGEPEDFPEGLRARYREYFSWPDTAHSGPAGLTRDVRVILETIEILTGARG